MKLNEMQIDGRHLMRCLLLLLLALNSASAQITCTPRSCVVPGGGTLVLTDSSDSGSWSATGGSVSPSTGSSTTLTGPAGTPAANLMAGCPVLPNDSIFNTDISAVPADPNTAAKVTNLQQQALFTPMIFQAAWGVSQADASTPLTTMTWYYGTPGTVSVPYPYGSPDWYRESGNYHYLFGYKANGNVNNQPDGHTMIVRRSDCTFYDTYNDFAPGIPTSSLGVSSLCQDSVTRGCNLIGFAGYSSNSYALVTGDTIDAAGLALAPLTWRDDEIRKGPPNHEVRSTWGLANFTSAAAGRPASGTLWRYPATGAPGAGCYTGASGCVAVTYGHDGDATNYAVMGSLFRLKSSFSTIGVCGADHAALSASCSVAGICAGGTAIQNTICSNMLVGLQKRGSRIADIGSYNAFSVSGDVLTDPDAMAAITMIQKAKISSSNYEFVADIESGLVKSLTSYQVTPNGRASAAGTYGGITLKSVTQSSITPTPSQIVVSRGSHSVTVQVQPIGIGTSWPLRIPGVMSGAGPIPIPFWVNPSTASQSVTWSVVGTGCGTVSGSIFTPPAASRVVSECSLHGVAAQDSSSTLDISYTVIPSVGGTLRIDSGSAVTTTDTNGNTWQADINPWITAGSASPIVGTASHFPNPWGKQYNTMIYAGNNGPSDIRYFVLGSPSTAYKLHILNGFPDGICTYPCGNWLGSSHHWQTNTFNPTHIAVNGQIVAHAYDWGYNSGYLYDQPADLYVPAVTNANGLLVIEQDIDTPDQPGHFGAFAVTCGSNFACAGPSFTPSVGGKYNSMTGFELIPDTNTAHLTVDKNLGGQAPCGGQANQAVICAGTTLQPFYPVAWGTTITASSTKWTLQDGTGGHARIVTNADGSVSISLAHGTYLNGLPITVVATNGSMVSAGATVYTAGGTSATLAPPFDPSTSASFSSVSAGMTQVANWTFGTGAGRNMQNTTELATQFSQYGIAGATVINQQWQVFQPFSSTSNYIFDSTDLDLAAMATSLSAGGINSGQLATLQTWGPPGAPGQPNVIAWEVNAKITYGQGAWPGIWLFKQQGYDAQNVPEVDFEGYVMTGYNSHDIAAYDHVLQSEAGSVFPSVHQGNVSDVFYSLLTNCGGTCYAPGLDFSAGFHLYQIVLTPGAVFKYIDGTLIKAARFKWTSPNGPQLLISNQVGSSAPGFSGLVPTNLADFPSQYQLKVEHVNVWWK